MRSPRRLGTVNGMARWKYVVLAVVVLPISAMLLFVGWVYVSFAGGLDDVLDFDHPERTDPEVVAAERRAQASDLPKASAEVQSAIGEGAPGASVVGAGAAGAMCEVGQHNFKIDDDFDLSCTATLMNVVAAPLAEEGDTAPRVDAALRSDGWVPVPRRPAGGGSTVTQGQDQAPYRYTRTEGGQTWRLVVDEADMSPLTYELRGSGRRDLRDSKGRPVSVEELVADAPRDGYAVVVGISVEYFRD